MNEISKKLITDFIECHADEIENIIRTALAEKKYVSDIKAGDHFEYNGIEWVCLDVGNNVENKTVFVVSAKIIANMPFNDEYENGCNNWRTSSLRKWLNSKFLYENFDKGALLTNFSTLTAVNGNRKYGIAEDYITLISCEQYRKYKKFMPKYGDWIWTRTPRSCNVGCADDVRLVHSSEQVKYSVAYQACGVAPACLFSFDYLLSSPQVHLLGSKGEMDRCIIKSSEFKHSK